MNLYTFLVCMDSFPKNISGIPWLVTKVVFCDDIVSNTFLLILNIVTSIALQLHQKLKMKCINETYTSARLHEYTMIRSQDNMEGSFLPPRQILGLKNPCKIGLTRLYCTTLLLDSLPINLFIWIIMLIVLQIHKVSFEIFFQSFMKVLPPAFNPKF